MSSELDAQNPNVPIALARAIRRREMLERMADQGMDIAERLATRSVAPEIGGDILRHAEMFAKIARGVRLTLILEGKLDGHILAYRKGDLSALDEADPAPRPRAARDIVRSARAVGDAEALLDHDSDLVEAPEYDRLPTGGFRDWVETICDDLGLDPDWSCWSDEEGFIRDDGRPVTEWPMRREPGGQAQGRASGEIDHQHEPHEAGKPPTPLPP